MGEQDSYRETFALWVGIIQVTKVSGSDHREEFRIGGRGHVKIIIIKIIIKQYMEPGGVGSMCRLKSI
jgi:hypothetical protein